MVIALKGQIGCIDRFQMLIEIAAAEAVMVIAGAVFRDPQGAGQNALQHGGTFHNTLGIDLPVQVIAGTVLPDTVADTGNSGAGIVVNAVKVGVFPFGQVGEIAQRKGKFAQAHGLQERTLEQVCIQFGTGFVPGVLCAFREGFHKP